MKKYSVIFPGNGLHNMEFLKFFFKKYNIIQEIFNEASDILHINIYKKFFQNKNYLINYKDIYQLIFISSISIYKLLKQKIYLNPYIMGGHSLGTYSALVCNKNILFKDSLRIIQIRNKILLLSAKNNRLLTLVIIGLNYTIIKNICILVSTKKNKAFISAINSNTQITITGNYSTVYTVGKICKKQFLVKIIRLPMVFSSHCELLKKYKKRFSYYLKKIKIFERKRPIISNNDSKLLYSKKDIFNSLLKQIYTKIQWNDNIKKIISIGIKIFIEIGPGQILSNLNKEHKKILSYPTNSNKKLLLVKNIIKKL
ncbi:hypothetical protein [Buchnera aphidicola]|uniref:Malonyl CoA-acyl carrier protein transacylase n=1 Tax=Buchnera aphidicola subsp. Cinara cedri (strain Cc) TaxID=372461 RepID=Q057L4_BUCCC|nr:hypothetical protein [Buchnera aphidicola]ABJ90685.1 malonyl CoA-acyl carrier protein transacylase [Buchnera aphidicola BCc]